MPSAAGISPWAPLPYTPLQNSNTSKVLVKKVSTPPPKTTTKNVSAITAWRGDPTLKTSLEFRVLFADNDLLWLPYSKDLDYTQVYADYTASIPCLSHLASGNAQEGHRLIAARRRMPISVYSVGDILYVDIRSYGFTWYDTLLTMFPDHFDKQYVVEYQVRSVTSKFITALLRIMGCFYWTQPSRRLVVLRLGVYSSI